MCSEYHILPDFVLFVHFGSALLWLWLVMIKALLDLGASYFVWNTPTAQASLDRDFS